MSRVEFAAGRKVTDGRGNVFMYLPHACDHAEIIPIAEASEEYRTLVDAALERKDPEVTDTPTWREALRTFVGFGTDSDTGLPYVAVCHDGRCYPSYWADAQIRACEVFVHGVVTTSSGGHPVTNVTVPGPRAMCAKVCYKTTPHFFDVEVWDQPFDRPASVGRFSGSEIPASSAGRKYQIVLRCEVCHHGYHFVTKEGSPSQWRRLMKDATARQLLLNAQPNH